MRPPFDSDRLDGFMEGAGADLVLATTKHNVQYLLGGYRFFFFAGMDAIGMSRYLPALGYSRAKAENAFYIGNPMEIWQQQGEPLWVPTTVNEAKSSEATAEITADLISKLGLASSTIAIEFPFFPADAFLKLTKLLPHAKFIDAVPILEEVRAIKRPDELAMIKAASEAIVDAMASTFQQATPGITTRQLAASLQREEIGRGLSFDYCLAATGRDINRWPSDTRWELGVTLSLDSGGTKLGYIGDLARMAVFGEPTPRMCELLQEVDSIQMVARHAILPGAQGSAIYESVGPELKRLPDRKLIEFEAHGIGLVSHEAPHLSGETYWPYPGTHARRPLEAGMVLSIETTLKDPEVGFVKLEDTVAVTKDGWEAYADSNRSWNVVGS